jgi:tripartite-type tricarboxylate transporter receptor subunit TctC
MTMPIGQNRTWRAVSSPSPRLPTGRLRRSLSKTGVNALSSSTGYGEGRDEGAFPKRRLVEKPPHPPSRSLSSGRPKAGPVGSVDPQAGRGKSRSFLVLLILLNTLFASVFTGPAAAAWPDRPITLIVPFAPGGPTDIIARILATALHMSLGQPVIIDNRAGAAGNTGMGVAAHATPDGYTLLLTSTSIAVNPALFKNLPYDPFRDFVPISELVNAPNVLIVKSSSNIKTLADLIAQAKAAPDKFNYSSPGAGTKSHLTGELLKLRAGIQMVHVPYRGAGPATLGVLEGTVQVGSVALPPAEPLIKDGQLRALAVTGAQRWFSLPEVPTMIESGYPNFVSDTFNALFAPTGTPPEIVATLVKESRAAFTKPEAREQARKAGFEIVAGAPEQLAARVAAEVPAVRELVAKAGIKTE